ncbi:hypothetical protein COU20_00310 [Candidatus Kaiserbacteria bacterium CG10_big_fil_rev_8_21_14_0_10_59_10]|uniref:Bacterial type II secretion system protein E domain-containing protein n=1 Tax=Candidatus Kaiserbacteria bacterium CG10_big_fil_rev_8_21_14_0_10_59_10 TaxID=1974612 RepID=A0A2H0U8Q7_9BACT|nr:MAG: hypothetical protein COU20_00310 [Candidatus Kaiserbacteria bacterium CG10_big_fil_rev_8_21_14_0_10_59_10]
MAQTDVDTTAQTTAPAAAPDAGVPERAVGEGSVPYEVLRLIPQESAAYYKLVPLALANGVLEVGMVDPDNIAGIDALNFITRETGTPFKIFRISENDFERVLESYSGLGGDVDRAVKDLQSEQRGEKRDETEAAPLDLSDPSLGKAGKKKGNLDIKEDAPTVKIASTILRYAIDGRASDVHIEPMPSGVRVRYRVDGELHTSVTLPLATHRALVARLKVLSSIRLDEQRKPQDGRFSASFDGRDIDFRVSTFPSAYGEKIVMRILDRDRGFIPLEDIGLTERNYEVVTRAIKRPHGLVLISGPTGSGKSTTLYSILSKLDRERRNIISLEDPIEYYVDGVIQSQIRPEIGYTFATGLRTTLRQDPDVIMVGEIRDSETAKLAVQAALTGHLVLSTIHTNDAVGTIPRLIDMGVEPYLIPSVLNLSMAQRLVRTLCPGTGKEVPLTESARRRFEAQLASLPEKYRFPIPETVTEPERTPECPTGMRGRMAVFEVIEMSTGVEKAILDGHVDSRIWETARNEGMLTMQEDAMLKAFAKQVPFSEVEALNSLIVSTEVEGEAPPAAEEHTPSV